MTAEQQIQAYISSIPEPKRAEVLDLHQRTLKLIPGNKLWFFDGKNEAGKVVSNPNIGYGSYLIQYAKGDNKESFRIGISANTTGISVYVLGIADKTFLTQTYGKRLGKASVTGYCIKFKSLKDIDVKVLEEAMLDGLKLK